jgi:transcriptional regulator with XRE-family HTH domain
MVRFTKEQCAVIGQALKEQRQQDELSQESLAVMLGTIQSIVSLIERGKRTHVGDSLWLALQEYIQKPELFEGAALYNDTAYPPPERKDDTNYNQMIYVRKKYRKVWRAAKRVARITGMGISELVLKAVAEYADRNNWRV